MLFFLAVNSVLLAETVEVKHGSRETIGTMTYEVSKTYIGREGFGNIYTITIQNNTDEEISVLITAKGCSGESESTVVRPYGRGEVRICTKECEVSGWAVKANKH